MKEKPQREAGTFPRQGVPANRNAMGLMGRRRQFRADRRRNHPRPLLSGPSGGLFSLSHSAPSLFSSFRGLNPQRTDRACRRTLFGVKRPGIAVAGRVHRVANSASATRQQTSLSTRLLLLFSLRFDRRSSIGLPCDQAFNVPPGYVATSVLLSRT